MTNSYYETHPNKTGSASPAKATLLLQGMFARWNNGEARTVCRETQQENQKTNIKTKQL